MINKTAAFTYFCKPCNYWGADLPVDIDSAGTDEDEISDEAYIASLEGLRVKNFGLILQQLKQQKSSSALSILDVGCASGLFMRVANGQGYTVTGIEPNQQLYALTQKHGLKVTHEYFPPKAKLDEKFDVIIFNDVFEHIPDVHTILNSCSEYLNEDGLLILNLPNAEGLIFRFSRILAKLGMLGPWNRLWQVMFRTPHLHYFSFSALNKLVNQHGFIATKGKQDIATIEVTGLWSRLSVTRSASALFKNSVLFLGTLVLYPFILFAEKDTFFVIYQRSKIKN